jgi:hypothetical protein
LEKTTLGFSREDFQSVTWRRLRAHLEGELTVLRATNDMPSLDSINTAVTRGSIAAIKNLLALGDTSATANSEPAESVASLD